MNPSEHRYRAFISYSQRDREPAKRLHTALESYRVPKSVSVPLAPNRRLGRFFRDNDETGASNDLGATLREALDQSENLIVICSLSEALGELGGLYNEGGRGAVEGLLKTTLSWVTAPTEQLKEVRPPAFITNGPRR